MLTVLTYVPKKHKQLQKENINSAHDAEWKVFERDVRVERLLESFLFDQGISYVLVYDMIDCSAL